MLEQVAAKIQTSKSYLLFATTFQNGLKQLHSIFCSKIIS